MTLTKRGEHWYGDSHADLREEVVRYSRLNGYAAEQFADAACSCGGSIFQLRLDENEGAAVRACVACSAEHAIGDSDEYLDDAEPNWRSARAPAEPSSFSSRWASRCIPSRMTSDGSISDVDARRVDSQPFTVTGRMSSLAMRICSLASSRLGFCRRTRARAAVVNSKDGRALATMLAGGLDGALAAELVVRWAGLAPSARCNRTRK
jgi:hypothetical protein